MAHNTVVQGARYATLEVKTGSTTYTAISHLREIGSIGGESNLISVPEFGRARALQIAGQQEPTEFTASFNWVGGDANVLALFAAGNTGSGTVGTGANTQDVAISSTVWRLTIKDASAADAPNTTLEWTGPLAAANIDTDLNDSAILNVTIAVSGDITVGTISA